MRCCTDRRTDRVSQTSWFAHLYDVRLGGFVDELVVQLQDEEGTSEAGRGGEPALIGGCVTNNIRCDPLATL